MYQIIFLSILLYRIKKKKGEVKKGFFVTQKMSSPNDFNSVPDSQSQWIGRNAVEDYL